MFVAIPFLSFFNDIYLRWMLMHNFIIGLICLFTRKEKVMFNTNPTIIPAKDLPDLVAQYTNSTFAEFVSNAKAVERGIAMVEKSKKAAKKAVKAEKNLRKAEKAENRAIKKAKKAEGAVAGAIIESSSFENLVNSAAATIAAVLGDRARLERPVASAAENTDTNTFTGVGMVTGNLGQPDETEIIITATDENGKKEVLSHTIENNVTGDVVSVADAAAAAVAANPDLAKSAIGNALLNPTRAPAKQQVQTRQPQRNVQKKD